MGVALDQASQLVAELLGVATDTIRFTRDAKNEVMNLLAVEVMNVAGLEIEAGSSLSAQSISDAIRAKILNLYGFDSGDLLDPESVKATMRREALRQVGESLGVGGTQSEIVSSLRGAVRSQVRAAVDSGDGDFLAAVAVGQSRIDDLARALNKNEWPTPITNETARGQKNRDKQARYRATHKRVWVQK